MISPAVINNKALAGFAFFFVNKTDQTRTQSLNSITNPAGYVKEAKTVFVVTSAAYVARRVRLSPHCQYHPEKRNIWHGKSTLSPDCFSHFTSNNARPTPLCVARKVKVISSATKTKKQKQKKVKRHEKSEQNISLSRIGSASSSIMPRLIETLN